MRAVLATLLLCLCVSTATAETGVASVYWEGHRTASGEHLCTRCLTAASPSLPFGTIVSVCRGSRCITVRINDRGPAKRLHRIIDLTPTGAHALGFSGLAHVTVTVLSLGASHAVHVHHRARHRVVRR